jgi:hypothetical protein
LYEELLAPLHAGKVIGVSLNTMGMDGVAALAELDETEQELGLPTADVVRPMSGHDGCRVLADAVLAAWEAHGAVVKKNRPPAKSKSAGKKPGRTKSPTKK